MTRFQKGNKAAAKSSRKAVAAMIRHRLEKDGDNLSEAQFTTLVNRFGSLTAKRRRSKKPEAKKVSGSFADRLTGEDAEIHRMVLQIEAEELAARRKKWAEEHSFEQEQPTTPSPAPIETVLPDYKRVPWTPKPDC